MGTQEETTTVLKVSHNVFYIRLPGSIFSTWESIGIKDVAILFNRMYEQLEDIKKGVDILDEKYKKTVAARLEKNQENFPTSPDLPGEPRIAPEPGG